MGQGAWRTAREVSSKLMSTTILLTEDERPAREVYHKLLERAGYHVIEAADASAALEALQHEQIDILLTDVLMPGMSGIELLERARQSHPDLRAIVMTGQKTSEAVIGALRNQAWEFLSKPFHTEELLEAVRSVLDRDC